MLSLRNLFASHTPCTCRPMYFLDLALSWASATISSCPLMASVINPIAEVQ